MKRPNVLWITALILGWLFDFLFWKHAPGISFAIYVLLCLVGGFVVLGTQGIKPARKALLLTLPIAFFAAMTFVRQEPLSLFLSHASTLFLLGVLAITFLGGRWLAYSLSDYAANFFRLTGSMIARPLIFASQNRRQLEEGGVNRGARRVWPILRGVLIAIPILAVFTALLASADLIFAQRLDNLIALFRLEKLPEYIFRGVYILIGAYLLAGVFLHAASQSQDEKLIGEEKSLLPAFLGFTEAAIVLGSVVLLFAVFVVIQFQYFFGGQANITIQGYTYAEYARRGFGELVAVAFFSLLLYLVLSAIVKRESPSQRWGFSGLGIGMVALVGIILASAFQRLLLYEAAYGFSRLRTYTHLFMLWLAVLLAVVIALETLRRERAFAAAALLAAIGFSMTLTLLNVDAFIVRQNVARAACAAPTRQGEELDVAYLASLSMDATPALVAAYKSASLPSGTRDAVGASLACISAGNRTSHLRGWQSFHLSQSRGERTLQAMQTDLKNYRIVDDNWTTKVFTPQGQKYECWGSGMSD
ncbi:MAG: DUF4173 domain-containing protein [Chloroflexota bacterium]